MKRFIVGIFHTFWFIRHKNLFLLRWNEQKSKMFNKRDWRKFLIRLKIPSFYVDLYSYENQWKSMIFQHCYSMLNMGLGSDVNAKTSLKFRRHLYNFPQYSSNNLITLNFSVLFSCISLTSLCRSPENICHFSWEITG